METTTKEQRLKTITIFKYSMWVCICLFFCLAASMYFTDFFGDLPGWIPLAIAGFAFSDIFYTQYKINNMRNDIEKEFN